MSETRRERILALAWSLLDLLPSPRCATGQLRAGQRREESGHHRELCQACDGRGKRRDRFGREELCGICLGAGRFWVDGVTLERTGPPSERVQTTVSTRVASRRVWCDRCGGDGVWKHARCDRCDGTGKVSMPVWADDEPGAVRVSDPVLSLLERRDRRGSWHELDLALADLRLTDGRAFRAFFAAHVTDGRKAGESPELERAYRFLDGRLPARVRVPSDVQAAYAARFDRARDRERQRRKRLGRTARAAESREWRSQARDRVLAGEPVQLVARELGVSVRSVQRAAYGTAA